MEVICSFRRVLKFDEYKVFWFSDEISYLVDTGKDYGLEIVKDPGDYKCDTVASDMPIIYRVLINHDMVSEFIWQDVIYETEYESVVMNEDFTLSIFRKKDILKYDYTHKNIETIIGIL